jgi:hypothetical protein
LPFRAAAAFAANAAGPHGISRSSTASVLPMTLETSADRFEALGLALLFAAIFAGAGRVPLPSALARREHGLVSFFAGLSLSYVFVHLLPELEAAKASLKLPVRLPLPPEAYLVAVAALAGCVLFFVLGSLPMREPAERPHPGMHLRLAIFAFYVALVSYSRIAMVEHGHGRIPVLFFAVAMGTHFLALDYALGRDLGALYRQHGGFVLAGASLFGWIAGATEAVGLPLMLLLFGFVAGAMIANSLIKELPDAREVRIAPFLAGSLLYTLILLPFG